MHTPWRLIGVLGFVVLAAQPVAHPVTAHAQDTVAREVVSGTLVKLDLVNNKGLMQTDLGRPIFFKVANPELFERLSIGTRVTVELDDVGRVYKVIDASVADFFSPAPEEPKLIVPPPFG